MEETKLQWNVDIISHALPTLVFHPREFSSIERLLSNLKKEFYSFIYLFQRQVAVGYLINYLSSLRSSLILKLKTSSNLSVLFYLANQLHCSKLQ
jgi:hypothetical protein